MYLYLFFFFKQKTAYEMRISDWSSDVCSSDLLILVIMLEPVGILAVAAVGRAAARLNEGGIPRIGAERTQRRRGVKGARSHLRVIRLEDQTAPIAPVIVERQNHALEAQRLGHSGGRLLQCARMRVPCRNAGAESSGRLDTRRRPP